MAAAPRIVTATYKVEPAKQAAFVRLLTGCEQTMRDESLVTGRAFLRMRSVSDPSLIVELFEWADLQAFDRAQENPKVLAWWGQYEAMWLEGGFGMNVIPETSVPWAQYEPLP